jgi:hypothetical protein
MAMKSNTLEEEYQKGIDGLQFHPEQKHCLSFLYCLWPSRQTFSHNHIANLLPKPAPEFKFKWKRFLF